MYHLFLFNKEKQNLTLDINKLQGKFSQICVTNVDNSLPWLNEDIQNLKKKHVGKENANGGQENSKSITYKWKMNWSFTIK